MTRYIDIPLSGSAFYDLSISLEGNSYIIQFIYNERMALYTMSLFDADKNPIVQGVALVPNYPIFVDYRLPNLTGYFLLINNSTTNTEQYKQYPDQIHKYYQLVYIYEEA